MQRVGAFMVGWIMGLAERWDPRSQLTKKDISPYFWLNGTMPNSKEFDVAENFASYRLRVRACPHLGQPRCYLAGAGSYLNRKGNGSESY